MRNKLQEAWYKSRSAWLATVMTIALLAPTVHHFDLLTWPQAIAIVAGPLFMIHSFKRAIEDWARTAELDTDDAELVDVHIDRRGRLRGSWRQRPHE